MNKRQRNSDSTNDGPADPNKQIRIRRRRDMEYFVGLDVHKNTVQAAVVDGTGRLLTNRRLNNTRNELSGFVAQVPRNARYVMESSSVWYGLFRYLRDELKLDVVLSNPYNTKIIATSLKKTDKVDAYHLANMLRGGYIAECHVPGGETIRDRQLVRARQKLGWQRAYYKNSIHGITLQAGIRTKGSGFTKAHRMELATFGDYRIDSYLRMIGATEAEMSRMNAMIRRAVDRNPAAGLLTSIPGVGAYTALAVCAELGDISRFADPHKLCAYAGLVPSVRNSADTVHHGRITKRGSRILRWLLVEAVHSHVGHAPDSDITAFYKRLAKKRGTGKAAVAAASKLLRVIFRMLVEGKAFAPQRNNTLQSGARPRKTDEGKPRVSNCGFA